MKKKKKQVADIDLMEEIEYYAKPRKAKKINQKAVGAGVLAVLLVGGLLFSPLFAVKTIRSEGNEHFTTGQLAEKISLATGDNLILFGKGKAVKLLKQDPYIADAKLKMAFPDTMVIQVTERKVRGYVPYMGAYLYIDEEGRVLDTQKTYYETLPVVQGLQFNQFTLGEILPAENKGALQIVLQMSQMMKKYELLDIVVELDVSDPEDIYVYVNQVEIHLGNMEDGDQKIRIMGEIVKTIPKEDRGTLDLRDLKKPIIFQYLV